MNLLNSESDRSKILPDHYLLWFRRVVHAFCSIWRKTLHACMLLFFLQLPVNTVYASERDALSLPLFKSGIIELEKSPSQISVGNPGIADILVLKGSQIHVIAKALGSTNVVFWDSDGLIFATVDVEVTHDLDSLKEKFFTLLPDENIGVHSAQEKLVLKGEISNAANLQAALDIADGFLPECIEPVSDSPSTVDGESTNEEGCEKAQVVNLLTIGGSQQVMLEVKIAEISRSVVKTLDTDLNILNFDGNSRFGAVNGGASFPNALTPEGLEVPLASGGIFDGSISPIGPAVDTFEPTTPSIADKGLFFSRLLGDSFFQVALEISRERGLAKILAEPNLTTLTGRSAEFISGGEFPIPVPTGDGAVGIEFRRFGVAVDFLPTIIDGSRISLDLDISVSEIASTNTISLGLIGTDSVFAVPSLSVRGASSTVELRNGQTIGIAGLIQDNVTEIFNELPGLADIPVLGQLFKSQEFVSGQTELVIFVTPHLAKPILPENIRLPTDTFVPPNDFEFYILGKMSSFKKPPKPDHSLKGDGGFDGVKFGHKL